MSKEARANLPFCKSILINFERMLMRFSDKRTGIILFIVFYSSAGFLVWLFLIKWHSLLRFIFH